MAKSSMIPLARAIELIIENTAHLEPRDVPLDEACGLVAAAGLRAPADQPPFARSTRDGYAVRAEDTGDGARLRVTGTARAGTEPAGKMGQGTCMKIMTGAPVPNGADAVVMIEDTDGGADTVVLRSTASPGQFITRAGSIIAKDDPIIKKGRRFGVQDIPLLAACDYSSVPAYPLPDVAVISTGDEIVDVGAERNAGQVPDINRHTLTAFLAQEGVSARFLGIAVDDEEQIRELVKRGLGHDMLLISGGVSMGDYDLVAKVLVREGVEPVFDRVSIKPGKPTFFGKKGDKTVFGLPGNPVSVFVTFYFFVRTALRLMAARKDVSFVGETGRLCGGSIRGEDRTSFVPVRAFRKEREIFAATVEYLGTSDDVAGLARANALMLVPEAPDGVEQGGTAHIYPFEPLF